MCYYQRSPPTICWDGPGLNDLYYISYTIPYYSWDIYIISPLPQSVGRVPAENIAGYYEDTFNYDHPHTGTVQTKMNDDEKCDDNCGDHYEDTNGDDCVEKTQSQMVRYRW